jgi:hypothetical protein
MRPGPFPGCWAEASGAGLSCCAKAAAEPRVSPVAKSPLSAIRHNWFFMTVSPAYLTTIIRTRSPAHGCVSGFGRQGNRSRAQTASQRPWLRAGSGKVGVRKDHPVLALSRIRAHCTARLVSQDRVLLLRFDPLPGFVRRQGYPLCLAFVRIPGVHNHPALLVASVGQASAGATGCPPQPPAMQTRIPVGTGGDGLGQFDHAQPQDNLPPGLSRSRWAPIEPARRAHCCPSRQESTP